MANLARKRNRLWMTVFGMLAMAGGLAAAEPVLRPGDRVVFLGDSITEGKIYTSMFISFFTMRQPGQDISFVRNAGVRGDTAEGAMRRLDKDVLAYKPTVVMICFGMNDGRVAAPAGKTVEDLFQASLTQLVATLKAAGVRVVLLTPGCIDTDNAARWFPDTSSMMRYNSVLARLGGVVKQMAAREQLPVADMFTPMMAVTAKGKSADPKFTIIPDGVHPTEPGGAVMAYALAYDLGFRGPASSLRLDVRGPRVVGERCRAQSLTVMPDVISFVRRDEALPPFVEPAVRPLAACFAPLRELCAYKLTLSGLPADSSWRLKLGGKGSPRTADADLGTFTAAQFAAGVDLAFAPGPWAALGEDVLNRCRKQEWYWCNDGADFFAARTRSWMPLAAKNELEAMLSRATRALAERETARKRAALAGLETTWTLTRISGR